MIHDLSEPTKRLIDLIAWVCAGVSVVGLLQGLALIVTIAAGLGSLSLVALRWHDRFKYGRGDE